MFHFTSILYYKLLIVWWVLMCSSCQSTQRFPDNEIPSSEHNIQNLRSFAEINIRMNEHQDAPHNPSFVVTIMNRSPIGDLTTYGNDSFSIEMYAPLHYPLWGNFVVWRDGERLWDIEPTQLEMYIKGTPMIETVLIRPGTGYLFTFDMVDNFPNHHEATQNFSIPRKEILSFSSLQTQHVKPFTTAGTYQIAFELLLPSFHKEGPLFQNRIRSNTLNYTLQ